MKSYLPRGQALVEYLIVFSAMALIGVGLVNSLKGFLAGSMGSLGYELSKELASGVCEAACFFSGYKNW